jgi:hypothetical protein
MRERRADRLMGWGCGGCATGPGISPAQARFALSEFWLDQFGARAQPLGRAPLGAAACDDLVLEHPTLTRASATIAMGNTT